MVAKAGILSHVDKVSLGSKLCGDKSDDKQLIAHARRMIQIPHGPAIDKVIDSYAKTVNAYRVRISLGHTLTHARNSQTTTHFIHKFAFLQHGS